MLINRGSLSQTVAAINAAHFDGRTLAAAERGLAARWIAARQGLPWAYGDTFAGFEKLAHYQQIAALQTIVLVDHRRPHIDLWTRHGEGWESRQFAGDEVVPLEVVGCTLPVEEVYAAAREA